MPVPITLVDDGGFPITEATDGVPMTPTDGTTDNQPGAMPATLVDSGGFPVVLVNDDLSAWEAPP